MNKWEQHCWINLVGWLNLRRPLNSPISAIYDEALEIIELDLTILKELDSTIRKKVFTQTKGIWLLKCHAKDTV